MLLKKRYLYFYFKISASSLFMLPGVSGFFAVNPVSVCKSKIWSCLLFCLEQDLVREGPQPLKFAGIGGLSEFLG